MAITEVTRQAIFDELHLGHVEWAGRLSEPAFLSRMYRLDELPSHDRRYDTATEDIHQHRVRNNDGEDDWVFTDPRFELATDDEKFLQFLAATVHPAVRPDQEAARKLVDMYNQHLQADGWELAKVTYISGRPVYAARSILTIPSPVRHVERAVRAGDTSYLVNQITRMETAVEKDPELAIGTAKELIETACKTVLDALGVEVDDNWNLSRLVKETSKQLTLSPDTVDVSTPGAHSIKQILGSLGTIVAGIAELRNDYGTGHGKKTGSRGLEARHARLAAGAASTFAVFLFETHNERTGQA